MLGKNYQRIICGVAGILAVALFIVLAFTAVSAEEKEEKLKLTFQAFAINQSNIGGGSDTVEIEINRWSTEAERLDYFDILREQGQEELWKVFDKAEQVGWARMGSGARLAPSTPLSYSHDFIQEDQRVIMLGTNRPIGFAEAESESRTKEYNISIIQLTLKKDDKGKWKGNGELIIGAVLMWDEKAKKFGVKSYASEPIRLNDVSER